MPNLLLLILLLAAVGGSARSVLADDNNETFKEAPKFYNSLACPPIPADDFCSNESINIAMTLDLHYLRGSMAAILSTLQHSSCPENIRFHFISSREATRRAGVLQRQFHHLLHPVLLVEPVPVADVRGEEGVLLQHGRDGDRSGAVEGRGLHDEDRGVDGAPEEDEDLRAGFSAAVPAGLRRGNRVGGSPVEPARAWWG
ncbi:unnamed protein product [Linum tenue]|uniref:Hexosyltransferase n=1 Tax=Linum tenue TaxID=586396 RepID=A0AAV0R9U7_9ROSI|nr:unnamed protein product [Linum tenue]